MTSATADHARAALRLAEADPARSARLAQRLARQARREDDAAALSAAERAWGLACLHLADPDTALRHLRAAIRSGQQARSPELTGEARMTLAYVLNVRGRSRQALREIEAALGELDGVAMARALAQRGAIVHQLGRLDDALPDYKAALPVLRQAGDHVWLQRVLANRAVLHGHRQDFAAAQADLREAAELCAKFALDLSLGFVLENMGWISGLRGDIPQALRHLDQAERCFRRHGAPVGELLTDRCQLLLSAQLISEARQAAEEAVRESVREHRRIALPEARLLLAQAALLDGQADDALRHARGAVREFGYQQRPRWAALARFTVLKARTAAGVHRQVSLTDAVRAASDLTAAGWPDAALDARLLAGKLALERGRTADACAQFSEAAMLRNRGPALMRARAWQAEALLRLASGNRRGAATAARTALRILDEQRAGLGATDLRAHASRLRVEVAELGLCMAFDTGRTAHVFQWAEHGRAGHLRLRPVQPPADPDLAAACAELRLTVGEIFRRRGAGQHATRLERRQIALERYLRDHYRHSIAVHTARPAAPPSARAVAAALAAAAGDPALIEFISLGGILHAVVIDSTRLRMYKLGPLRQAADLIARMRFALHRLSRQQTGQASRAAAHSLLSDSARRLDALLLQPLAGITAGRPLVVVPTGPLQSLPWPVVPSCVGREVTVTPSAFLWLAGLRGCHSRGHILVAAGPGLPGAASEAAAVASLHQVTALSADNATVSAVTAALDGAAVAHLTAHGHINPDNPLFTSLMLADGPLTVYDLNHLSQPPHTVILAACDVGRSVVRPGDELLGLSATFLALGTRHIIASVVPVPDAETAPVMIAFHRHLLAGHSPAAALASAQRQLDCTDPAATAALGFISIGTAAPAGQG